MVDKLEWSRAESLSLQVVKQYFELLNEVMEKNKLKNSPQQVYNCDEMFVPLNFTREKVVNTSEE